VRRILLIIFFPFSIWAAKLHYDVRFYGVTDPSVLKALESSSELILLQDQPPASINGLHYRAKADIPSLLKVLKAFAYYEAEISYEIQAEGDSLEVDLYVHMGSLFRLRSYEIFHGDCTQPLELSRCTFCLEDLGLNYGEAADSTSIVRAENAVLTELARCGYPLAYIDKRRVLVDMKDAEVDASVCVQEGPLSEFGPSSFFGLKSVHPRFLERKVAWREGEVFNLDLIEETQNRLLKTDLFSSVLVSYAEELDGAGELPLKIRLAEAKHRSVSLGVSYATIVGPGGSFSWSHRNFRGVGEKLSLSGEASTRFIGGKLLYQKPDFLRFDQSLTMEAEAQRESIRPYLSFTYGQSNMLERQLDNQRTVAIGLKGQYITVHESANNGNFFLLGLPIYMKYTTADSPVDPTKGYFISYLGTPYQSLQKADVQFVKQRIVVNFYFPLMEKKRMVLALHSEFGSVAGTDQKNVPLPKLLLGGSQDDLRGYTYKTVSPLNPRGQPLGGRAAIFTSIELRVRITETIGLVPFADFGTVSLKEWPEVSQKWFKSVGGGVRYYTFFGPLRLDVGFPLNPRKGLDTWGKVYASIGQSF
jgi:translocation and assembly module TamA